MSFYLTSVLGSCWQKYNVLNLRLKDWRGSNIRSNATTSATSFLIPLRNCTTAQSTAITVICSSLQRGNAHCITLASTVSECFFCSFFFPLKSLIKLYFCLSVKLILFKAAGANLTSDLVTGLFLSRKVFCTLYCTHTQKSRVASSALTRDACVVSFICCLCSKSVISYF